MGSDLRCDHKLHGIIVEEGVIEVRCNSSFCGSESGVVILHRFSTKTGELIKTLKYKNPRQRELIKSLKKPRQLQQEG